MFKQQIINKVGEKYIELIKKYSVKYAVSVTDVEICTLTELRLNAEQKNVLTLVHIVKIRGDRKDEFKLDEIV